MQNYLIAYEMVGGRYALNVPSIWKIKQQANMKILPIAFKSAWHWKRLQSFDCLGSDEY